MFLQKRSVAQESGSNIQLASGVAPAVSQEKLSDIPELTPLLIPGSWSVKATFLTYSGPGIPGAGPHWWIAVFVGIDSASPEVHYTPAPPNVLILRSNQDAHSMGTWNASSGDSATFSLVMQLFQSGEWKGNLNMYAQELCISSDGKTFTTSTSNPVQVIQYDTSGMQVGQATMSLQGTRIPIEAADVLPIQS